MIPTAVLQTNGMFAIRGQGWARELPEGSQGMAREESPYLICLIAFSMPVRC